MADEYTVTDEYKAFRHKELFWLGLDDVVRTSPYDKETPLEGDAFGISQINDFGTVDLLYRHISGVKVSPEEVGEWEEIKDEDGEVRPVKIRKRVWILSVFTDTLIIHLDYEKEEDAMHDRSLILGELA